MPCRGLLDVLINFFQTLYKFRLYVWLLWGLACTPLIKRVSRTFFMLKAGVDLADPEVWVDRLTPELGRRTGPGGPAVCGG